MNRSAEICRAITEMTARHGYPPTIRELGDELGIAAPSSVQYWVDQLVDAGQVRRDPRRSRSLRVASS